MVNDISELVGAIQDLVKVTKENSDRLQDFIEGGTRPMPTKSIDDLRDQNPVSKVHEYLVQKMKKIDNRETRENIQKFTKEADAKAYIAANKGVFRTLIETKYLESNPPTDA